MKKQLNLLIFLTLFLVLTVPSVLYLLSRENEREFEITSSEELSSAIPNTSMNQKPFSENTILVKFASGTTKEERKKIAASVNGTFKDMDVDGKDDNFKNILDGRLALIELHGEKEINIASNAVILLSNNEGIEYAELNYIYSVQSVPNDSYFDRLWAMRNTGQTGGTPGADIKATEAWDTTVGSNEVIVGIIDTGLNYNHEDLRENVWTNPNEIYGNERDDDGNGYIDDMHGINAITGVGDPMDDHLLSHGTLVSGVIGGQGNNRKGITGVNWRVKLIGLKAMDYTGYAILSDCIKCVDYAVALKNRGVNIRIINAGWQGKSYSQTLKDSIVSAYEAGMIVVAAAGNGSTNLDYSPRYPACYDVSNILVVTATDHNDVFSHMSYNYGVKSVDMGAPGVKIYSTTITGYNLFNGTSAAGAHVSGAAAILLSIDNNLSVKELINILMESGDELPTLRGRTVTGKRLNLKKAVDTALTKLSDYY